MMDQELARSHTVSPAESIVDSIQTIPALPLIITYVLELTSDDDVSSLSLAHALEADPGLTAKILRISNSAYYAPKERVYTVRDAIRFVGFETVRSLVVTSTVVDRMWVDDKLFTRPAFWKHSLRCGLFAREIAMALGHTQRDLLFTIGVLHDIGRSALIQFNPPLYGRTIELMRSHNIPLWQAEDEMLGTNHALIGSMLANKWNLPDSYSKAIALHHDPQCDTEHEHFATIIRLADALAHSACAQDRQEMYTPPLIPPLWEPLGLSAATVKDLLSQAESIESYTREMYETATY